MSAADPVDLGVPGLRVAREIGRGGFGVVYRAHEPELGREVAVKVLHERTGDDRVRRDFDRECRAMGTLSGHPNIVAVHRGGVTAAGAPYIVMALQSGGSLADRMRSSGPLPWPDAVDVAVKIAGALETAHRHQILHLDVKPANILISPYGEPALGDFGISRLAGAATATGGPRMSLAFAAPERLGRQATAACDVYSLGATLVALVTGRPPFTGDNDLMLMARVVQAPPLRPRGVPSALSDVLDALLAKNPVDRPGSALAAAELLQQVQQGGGLPVTRAVVDGQLPARAVAAPTRRAPSTGPDPTRADPGRNSLPTPPTRRRWVVAFAAAFLVGALGVTGWTAFGPGDVARSDPDATATAAPTVIATAAPAGPATAVLLTAGIEHPEAEAVRSTVQTYLVGLNEERYAASLAAFSEDSRPRRDGLEVWIANHTGARIYDPVLTGVRDAEDGRVEADVTYLSRQPSEIGPQGHTCSEWERTYSFVLVGSQRLIDRSVGPPPTAC